MQIQHPPSRSHENDIPVRGEATMKGGAITVRIGACQLPEVRRDPATAVQWMETRAIKAQEAGVDLLCFPECFLQGYLTEEESARQYALSLESPSFQAILHQFSPLKPVLVFGLIEADQGKLHNTAVVIERGRLQGRYRKTHLLAGESCFTAGDAYPVFETKGLKFGINICHDTNFPAAAAALADQGARLILCPANNMLPSDVAERWRHRHNEIRIKRVQETGLWLISSDVTGTHENAISYGPTAVLRPDGKVVSQVPLDTTGMVTADIEF